MTERKKRPAPAAFYGDHRFVPTRANMRTSKPFLSLSEQQWGILTTLVMDHVDGDLWADASGEMLADWLAGTKMRSHPEAKRILLNRSWPTLLRNLAGWMQANPHLAKVRDPAE